MTDQLFTPLKSHPSTFEAEAEALRAENAQLTEERNRALAWRDKDWQASQDNEALRARVATLKKALVKCVNRSDLPRDVERIAFAALQEDVADEATTQPHNATSSAKSALRRG